MSDGSIEVVSGTTRRKQTISDSDQSSPQIVSADFGHAFAAYQRKPRCARCCSTVMRSPFSSRYPTNASTSL